MATPNSNVEYWTIIEIWDTEVPEEILKALFKECKDTKDSSVYSLMWGEPFFFHGEDGWCLNEDTLEGAEKWLEEHREFHGISDRSPFWFRVKVS